MYNHLNKIIHLHILALKSIFKFIKVSRIKRWNFVYSVGKKHLTLFSKQNKKNAVAAVHSYRAERTKSSWKTYDLMFPVPEFLVRSTTLDPQFIATWPYCVSWTWITEWLIRGISIRSNHPRILWQAATQY